MGFWRYCKEKIVGCGLDVQTKQTSAKEEKQPSYTSASQGRRITKVLPFLRLRLGKPVVHNHSMILSLWNEFQSNSAQKKKKKKSYIFMPLLPSCYSTADFCESKSDLHSIVGDEDKQDDDSTHLPLAFLRHGQWQLGTYSGSVERLAPSKTIPPKHPS